MSHLIGKLDQLQDALESYWDDLDNLGYATDSGSVYDYADDLKEMGLGGVLICTRHGQIRWFDLEEMCF